MNDTILAICERMRELQDFSALPILADALEEVGREKLANECRKCPEIWSEQVAIVAEIMGGKILESLRHLEQMCLSLRHEVQEDLSYDEDGQPGPLQPIEKVCEDLVVTKLMSIMRTHISDQPDDNGSFLSPWKIQQSYRWPGIHGPDVYGNTLEQMWQDFHSATGIPDRKVRESVFRCGC